MRRQSALQVTFQSPSVVLTTVVNSSIGSAHTYTVQYTVQFTVPTNVESFQLIRLLKGFRAAATFCLGCL